MIASLLFLVCLAPPDEQTAARWWDAKVSASLDRAPGKKAAWEKALSATPKAQRGGMAYLVAYLPKGDLASLPPEALAKNVALAYEARASVPWGAKLPDDVFLDAVLPHASLTEPRDPMRSEFFARYLPLVKDCLTPGAAACRINEHLFKDYHVTYNTRRLRTDQCSRESIAQGMATCTGLSVMLVEACRAVGVPARVAAIASWPGRGGNHTWAEVWNDGWHFVGAAEPDAAGLDHAWFAGDAAKAVKDSPKNAVWALTYRATGEHAPLKWDPAARVNGENVSDRYANRSAAAALPPRLMVDVKKHGERVVADVWAVDETTGKFVLSGKSLGPSADVNLHLSAPVPGGRRVVVLALADGRTACGAATVAKDTLVRIDLDLPQPADLSRLLGVRFASGGPAVRELLARIPWDESMRGLAWRAFKDSTRHESLKKELEKKTVTTPDRTSPYLWRKVGNVPEKGWPLVIAMHGGGGAPKAVNDGQWKRMFESYYRDHSEAGGYIYLALRAPNDEWNGFYDDAICPLVARMIEQFVLFEHVDPDRVYALGASHGGYGAFVTGPKMPDRFAAVHASAAAPTDGETQGENLRNLSFSFMVGERDTAHGRADRCQSFAKRLDDWRARHGGYPVTFEWKPGVGHSVPDRDKLVELLKCRRNPRPSEIVWVQSDGVLKHFYWLEATEPVDAGRIVASIRGNSVTVKTEKQAKLALWLDAPLVDLSRPLTIDAGGRSRQVTLEPTLETFCRGLEERSDPELAAPVRIEISLSDQPGTSGKEETQP
jgi:poly(3-hydroxybutyrate) depolymerase